MPPPRRIRPLRPCYQTRRAFNASCRRPLSTRRGDDPEAQERAQDVGNRNSTEPGAKSRGKGWWASFAKRLSSSIYGQPPDQVPQHSALSDLVVEPERQPATLKTTAQHDGHGLSESPVSLPGEILESTKAALPEPMEVRPRLEKNTTSPMHGSQGEEEKHLATHSSVQSRQIEAELGAYKGSDQALQDQLKELREQVRLLQEALVAKQAVLPVGDSSRGLLEQGQRVSSSLSAELLPPLSPVNKRPANGSSGNATSVQGGARPEDFLPLMNAARHLIKVNGSRLVSISRQLREMNSSGIAPLQRSLNETVEIFKNHLSEVYSGVAKRRPRFIVIESLLSRAESELQEALEALGTLRSQGDYVAPKSVMLVAGATADIEKETGPLSTSEKLGGDHVRLVRRLHTKTDKTRSREPRGSVNSRKEVDPEKENYSSAERPGQESRNPSLLEELFPEATTYAQPHYTPRNPFPKLDPPKDVPLIRPTYTEADKTVREHITASFRARQEPLTALQLVHCSTELTEADFRRLIPKGKHIQSWIRDGEFEKIIPGRDPLTLERLPFYYLLFKSPESALAYQNNAARLHKLSALHQRSSIFSAIPPPVGFVEDGEDLNKAMSTYFLKPTSLNLSLHMVLQPYNPSLRGLIERGGYEPIVPSVGTNGQPIWKVLLHIEGWEPSRDDLYHTFKRHAYDRGFTWPFHDGSKGIHRLRDVINVNVKLQAVSSANPRAVIRDNLSSSLDPLLGSLALDPQEPSSRSAETNLKQIVMNRLYNRWIVEFEEELAARRFARMWHRRLLPAQKVTWKDTEEPRMINAEYLW